MEQEKNQSQRRIKLVFFVYVLSGGFLINIDTVTLVFRNLYVTLVTRSSTERAKRMSINLRLLAELARVSVVLSRLFRVLSCPKWFAVYFSQVVEPAILRPKTITYS